MARLQHAFPQVEIESCSGGGGRIDFGVLRHTQRVWTSDCIDALSRVDIQRGFLQFFPPEIMGAHVGTAPAHSTGRSQSMAFRAAVALPGHLGVELDARSLSAADAQELRGWIAVYKQLRERLHHGRVWRGHCADGVVWQAHGDEDRADLLLLAYRLRPSDHRYPPALRLPMLDPAASYRVNEVLPAGAVRKTGRHDTAPFFDAINTPEGLQLHGAWLAQAGLPLPRAQAETVFIVRLTRL
jgi:alpha-galactosidase